MQALPAPSARPATSGTLHPVVSGRFPLPDAADAHALIEQGRHAGKVILVTTELDESRPG